MDHRLDAQAFEAMIIQQRMKYLKSGNVVRCSLLSRLFYLCSKAKLYFQVGRCRMASTLAMNERQQMKLLNIARANDLLLIRFWQKGLSRSYKQHIRLLKHDDNQNH